MKMPKVTRLLLLLILLLMTSLLIQCSSNEKASDEPVTKKPVLTDEKQLEYDLSKALARLRYGDKTGLYDFEFPYLRDETPFDDYLKMRQIVYAVMDTIYHLELKSLTKFGEDSALAYINYVFKGYTGKITKHHDQFIVYKYNDQWVKPTASSLAKQLEFDELVKAADEASE